MYESDYERGLRGGLCNVNSSTDWERYRDWKAGHDEYERRMEAEDEERYAVHLSPAERVARINERLARLDSKEREHRNLERRWAQEGIERRQRARMIDNVLLVLFLVVAIGLGCLVGAVVGGIVRFLAGTSFSTPFVIVSLLASAVFVALTVNGFSQAEAARKSDDARDRAKLR